MTTRSSRARIGHVGHAERIDRKQRAGNVTHRSDGLRDRRMHAVIVAGREIDDREASALELGAGSQIADQLADVVAPCPSRGWCARLDHAEVLDPPIGGRQHRADGSGSSARAPARSGE